MAKRVGQQLGNYRLVRLLGTGGFAEVYLGEHIYLKSNAAIKVLQTNLAEEDIAGFLAEAQTLVRLTHPHIVRLLDFGLEGNTPFLVMDYAPNGTLRQAHRRGERLPLTTVVGYVSQVADALQYAHEEKVIHRDVKPENMLLGRRNEVLLSDFGIAIVAQSTLSQGTQDAGGTIAYMAPEQIQAHPRPTSDQYALAVVVYEWLSGERPFNGSFTEIAAKHCTVPPPPLHEKLPTVSSAVEQIVMTALAKDPKQRFAHIQDFATALKQAAIGTQFTPVPEWGDFVSSYRSGSGSDADWGPLSSPVRFVSPSNQTPAGLATLSSQSALPTELVTPLIQPLQTAEMGPSSSQHTVSTPSGQIAPPLTADSFSTQIAPPLTADTSSTQPVPPPIPLSSAPSHAPKRSISRRTMILGLAAVGTAVAGSGGIAWLLSSHGQHTVVKSTQTPPTTPIPAASPPYTYRGHSSGVNAVVWSPDGTTLASGSDDKTVQVWNPTNGGLFYTYRGHTDAINALAWSPDGTRVASASYDGTVQVWNAATGKHLYTYRGHINRVLVVTWSPDSKLLASGGDDKTVQVWDPANGKLFYTYRGHTDIVETLAWSPDGKRIASGSNDHTVQAWNVANGSHVYTYRGHSNWILSALWSPDGKRIASASQDKTVQLWAAVGGDSVAIDGKHAYTYRGHSDHVYEAAWSPDGKRIASASDDKTVQVWTAIDGSHVYTYHGHSDHVYTAVWSPNGQHLASCSADKTVQVWVAG